MNYKGSTYITEETIKLAGDEKKDRLYEPKQNQKAIKVLTVAAYVLCVSLAAIMLSFYYIFIWNSSTKPNMIQSRTTTCDKIVIPDGLEKLLANASEISLETFLKNYSMRFKLDHEKIKMIQIQEIKHFPHLFERLEQKPAAILNSNSNNNNMNNNNNENSYDTLESTTPISLTETDQALSDTTTSPGSSLFLSDSPAIVSRLSASSLSSSPSGLLLKKLKEINQNQPNRKDKKNNKEIDEGGENGDKDDEDDDNDDDDDGDDDDDDDDTEQEDYYEPSGQKEISVEKLSNNNKTIKNFD